ncbi:MAG TPA: hypothetical protein DCR93_04340 [Cytophagales bacterium]|nr:hypothetical protein [Cytophagales bacterium]HAP58756.1 hypothetical protein [Cytophagales bacterium]
MKKFFNNLVGAVLIALALHLLGWGLQAIVSIASPDFGASPVGRSIGNFFKVGAVIMFVFSLVYPYLKGKIKVKRAWIGQVLLVFGLVIWGMLSFQKSKIDLLYLSLKKPSRGWYGQPHVADDQLGYAPNPGAQAFHTFPDSTFLPMRWSEEGFRIPVEAALPGTEDDPLVLFLGCSFTYGDAVAAENTFSYLVADSLGYRYQNAGVCGWGLAQIYLRGKELIQQYQPDYVVLQYSPWLVERGVSNYAPSYSALIPSPYIYNVESGVQVAPPPFRALGYSLPVNDYKQTAEGFGDYLSFAYRVGWRLVLYEWVQKYRTSLRRKMGKLPPLNRNQNPATEQAVYQALVQEVKNVGGTPILLALSNESVSEASQQFAKQVNVAKVADGDHALWSSLSDSTKASYSDTYHHWRMLEGTRTRVDQHPNEHAHALIANTIIEQIISE